MSYVKFKISLTRCKEYGLYNTHSSFLDLEKNLQTKCRYNLSLDELRNDKNINQYREWVHKNKNYEKTSISICFDLPETVIDRYGLQDKNNKEGKQLFQDEHIFTPEHSIKRTKMPNLPSATSLHSALAKVQSKKYHALKRRKTSK